MLLQLALLLQVLRLCAGFVLTSTVLKSPTSPSVGHRDARRRGSSHLGAELRPSLEALLAGKSLTSRDTEEAIAAIMKGAVPAEQVAAFLCMLRMKGETATEIAGCVRGMQSMCVPVDVGGRLLDIVGTGGDGAHTINLSTASVILAASAGAKVCKFGNRSVSSMCGSADVLEALGVSVELTAEQVARCCEECGISFMFAPNHYPAMKHVAPIRKALGVRTIFNILGPMTNPAGAQHAVIGVFHEELMPLMAGALKEVGYIEHAVIVHGCGLDEISPLGPSSVLELRNTAPAGQQKAYETSELRIDPRDFGIPICSLADLRGGSRDENAQLLREALRRGEHTDAKRDAIVLNTAMGLYVYGSVVSVKDGVAMARKALEAGAGLAKLDEWIKTSQKIVNG